MNLEEYVRNYINKGYEFNDAKSKVAQDIVLTKICKSNFKKHITVKGGVVMHSISNSIRRATRDLDLNFIKYSLDDGSIYEFIEKLNSVNDNNKLLKAFKVIIFDNEDMREKTINDIISILESILSSKIYKSNLSNPKVNWLDISTDDVISKVLDYIYELETETVAV